MLHCILERLYISCKGIADVRGEYVTRSYRAHHTCLNGLSKCLQSTEYISIQLVYTNIQNDYVKEFKNEGKLENKREEYI